MPDNWIIKQSIDLANSQTSPIRWADTLFVNGDKEAHTWEVHVARNGAPVDLTGAFGEWPKTVLYGKMRHGKKRSKMPEMWQRKESTQKRIYKLGKSANVM